jgi:hypothetical protein
MSEGWRGIDLDGTLAKYTEYTGPTVIGEPIPLMVERVKKWLSLGEDVRIFTARVADQTTRSAVTVAIQNWCILHIGQILPITNKKDHQCIEIWDDRAVQVILNTGRRVDGKG